jgi:hypothetical protein
MSFLGNIAAAESAKAIGNYNNKVYQQQAALKEKQKEQRRQIFNAVTRPQVVRKQETQYSQFLVNVFKSGAEFRPGTTPYLVGLENKNIDAFNIATAEFNAITESENIQNEAIMLRSQGEGELYKANLTARSQYIAAVGSLLGDANMAYGAYDKYSTRAKTTQS